MAPSSQNFHLTPRAFTIKQQRFGRDQWAGNAPPRKPRCDTCQRLTPSFFNGAGQRGRRPLSLVAGGEAPPTSLNPPHPLRIRPFDQLRIPPASHTETDQTPFEDLNHLLLIKLLCCCWAPHAAVIKCDGGCPAVAPAGRRCGVWIMTGEAEVVWERP